MVLEVRAKRPHFEDQYFGVMQESCKGLDRSMRWSERVALCNMVL